MLGLRFPMRFIRWVMGIVRIVSYMLVMNGEKVGYFKDRKWLRQRDPISLLLFVI